MDRKSRKSAGILLYRDSGKTLRVLLAHPGGPFWKNRDAGAWTIPKGEPLSDEELPAAALREFFEETGYLPAGDMVLLSPVKQKGGKWIHAWAMNGDMQPDALRSNTFEIEWPPGSGKKSAFPEIDRVQWFTLEEAANKINPAQMGLLDELRVLIT